jgi:hypothetical protein
VRKLQDLAKAAQKEVSVAVGYTADYALPVHENMEARHEIGQAKFLEEPARQNAPKYAGIIVEAINAGKTVTQAYVLAGLELQRDSQLLAPVLTGNLRGSAFTRIE